MKIIRKSVRGLWRIEQNQMIFIHRLLIDFKILGLWFESKYCTDIPDHKPVDVSFEP